MPRYGFLNPWQLCSNLRNDVDFLGFAVPWIDLSCHKEFPKKKGARGFVLLKSVKTCLFLNL